MNERIKELLNQAGGEFYEGFAGSTNFVKFAEDDFEKFAELIVAECASKADSSLRDWLHDNSGKTVGDKVREHFGVEE
jgi:hypothetical protein